MKKFITTLKNTYWWIKGEIKDWIRFIINIIPGSIGLKIRGTLLPKEFKSCGKNIILHRNFRVNNPSLLTVGDNFLANENCYINAGGEIIIGDDVMLGPDVKIWSVNHSFADPNLPFNRQGYRFKKVKIGNNVWIGANSFIVPGATICDNVIIGAGSIVSKSIKTPYSLVVGNPAVVVKRIDKMQ